MKSGAHRAACLVGVLLAIPAATGYRLTVTSAFAEGSSAQIAVQVDVLDRFPTANKAANPISGQTTAPPLWIRAGAAQLAQPLAKGQVLTPGDEVRSAEHQAIRLAVASFKRTAITVGEGSSVTWVATSQPLLRFQLADGGALFAALPDSPARNVFPIVVETSGIFIGSRRRAQVFLLGAQPKSMEPAAVYAVDGEIELASTLEGLRKGEGLRVPSQHVVVVTGPNGFESPRPVSSISTMIAKRYPSLNRIRGAHLGS